MPSGRFNNLEFQRDERTDDPENAPAALPNELRDADFYVAAGRSCELADDAETALRNYSAALGEDPLRLDAWVGQLWILYELGEYPEVELWARKALERFPDNPALVAMRSLAALGQKKHLEARELNDSALARKGESDTVWLARADILMTAGGAPAEDCLAHARRAGEVPEMICLRSARICLRHRCYRLALSILHELTERCPESAAAWHLLGVTQWRMGDLRRAYESLEQARELAPRNPAIADACTALARQGRGGPLRFVRRLFSR